MTTRRSLCVIVPATDDPPTLARCRAALAASVDRPDQIVVVREPSDLSASAARNEGARRTDADVLVFVDADVEVHPDALGRIRDAFSADAALTAVHGSYDDSPAAVGTVSVFRNLLHHHIHQTNPGPADTFWTGLGAVRRDAFVAAGGFDEERYPHPSVEDIELGHRLVANGGNLLLDPSIQGTHLKRWTLRSMIWTDFARRGVPWMHLQLRERSAAPSLNLGWRHRLTALLLVVAVVSIVAGSPVVAAVATALVLVVNHALYLLLANRQGVLGALVGVLLHAVHHLVGVAAAGTAIVAWAATGFEKTPAVATAGDEPEGILQL